MDVNKLINWGELSRTLSGTRSALTQKRIPIKHAASVNALKDAISDWYKQLNNKQ